MSGESFIPTMGSISNRAFISRMEQWGWKVKKTSGETTLMVAPNGKKVEVRSAHIKQGNSKFTFEEVLADMGMTWSQFIRPLAAEEINAIKMYLNLDPEEQHLVWEAAELSLMTEAENVKAQQRAQELRIRDERRAEQKRERDRKREENRQRVERAAHIHKEEVAVSTQPVEPIPVIKSNVPTERKPGGGVSNAVLDVLYRVGGPISTERIAQEPGMERFERKSIQKGGSYLVELGLARRVKNGVYQITESGKRSADVKVGIDITTNGGNGTVYADPTDTKVNRASSEPVRDKSGVPVDDDGVPYNIPPVYVPPEYVPLDVLPPRVGASTATTETEEDILNETLDLLFPNGFKARHLPFIDDWRKATVALMREINN